MNALTVFNNSDFGQIRATKIEGKPWFVGKDVAEALGYSNPVKAITAHVRKKYRTYADKTTHSHIGNELGQRGGWLINENGLYELIMKSEMETAEQFQEWVYETVLPSIRQNGGYVVGQENASASQMDEIALLMKQMRDALNASNALIEKQSAQIEADRPKVEFAEMVEETADEVAVADLALLASQKGTKINRNSMMAVLRARGYLSKNNRPKQKYVDEGIFTIRFTTIKQRNGETKTVVTPRVTGKGVVYLLGKLCGNPQTARAG